jgi:hypothetical protein
MKRRLSTQRTRGFTGWDLLICVVTVVLFVSVFLPYLARPRCNRSPRITCVYNLKQIGLAFRMWDNDHGEKFPMNSLASNTNEGTLEFALTGEVWRHFQIISNELNTPKVLVCPTDNRRSRITDWQSFTNNSHLSYFVGLDADETKPQTILSGDRNLISSKVKPVKGVLNLTSSDRVEWTKDIHNQMGNIGLGDGSAQQVTTPMLNKQLQSALLSTTQAVHRLALPE